MHLFLSFWAALENVAWQIYTWNRHWRLTFWATPSILGRIKYLLKMYKWHCYTSWNSNKLTFWKKKPRYNPGVKESVHYSTIAKARTTIKKHCVFLFFDCLISKAENGGKLELFVCKNRSFLPSLASSIVFPRSFFLLQLY